MADDENGGPGRAPALEKGLDILELLASQKDGLLQKEVAGLTGRSASEIFRVLGVLERRGYIARDADSGRYWLTLKLFELGNVHPPLRRMLEVAMPLMETFATGSGCSCHLVIRHNDGLMVIAHAQPDAQLMGWTVKVGAYFPLSVRYASARMIAAFQHDETRERLLAMMLDQGDDTANLRRRLARLREDGFEMHQSGIAPGVTDISCPVLNHLGVAAAALTAPVVDGLIRPDRQESSVLPALLATAAELSARLGGPRSEPTS